MLDEPSVVAVNTRDGRPLAVGIEAKRMIGRTPGHIQAIRPLKDGVIADFDICEKMLRYFIQRVHPRRWAKPAHGDLRAVGHHRRRAARGAGGGRVRRRPQAGATSSRSRWPPRSAPGLPVHEPAGNMIVDIGGGTTEVAVISLGGIVASESIRIARRRARRGDHQLREEGVLARARRAHRRRDQDRARRARARCEEELYAEVRGRDLVTGLPKTIVVSTEEIREAIEEPVAAIVDAVKVTLDKTPPELAADIMEKGIVITGGGALLHGLDERLQAETGMPIVIARRTRCTRWCIGSGQCLEKFDVLQAGPDLLTAGLTVPAGRLDTVVVYRHDRRRRLTLVLLVITSLALISLDERGSGIIDSARTAAQDVVSPLQTLADDVINPVADWFDGLGRANELQDQNEQLRRQLADGRSEVAAAKGSAARLAELEQILDLPSIDDSTGITADVVSQGAGNFTRTFQISKGSNSGIVKGYPGRGRRHQAMAPRSSARSCRCRSPRAVVRRIDDRNFGVGAHLVQGDTFGPAGTATGQPDSNLLRFSVIVDSATGAVLKRGDVAVTLGGDKDLFPPNLVIGTVVHEVGAGGAIARDAELRPIVDLDALTVVKVLK